MITQEDYVSAVTEYQTALASVNCKDQIKRDGQPTDCEGRHNNCEGMARYDKWGDQSGAINMCFAMREADKRRFQEEREKIQTELSDLNTEYKQQQEDQLRNQIREFTFQAIVEASKAIPQEEIIPALEEVPVIPVEDTIVEMPVADPIVDTQPIQRQSPQSNALPLILGGLILLG